MLNSKKNNPTYGSYCRSLAFNDVRDLDSLSEFLEIYQNMNGSWNVAKVLTTQSPTRSLTGIFMKRKSKSTDIHTELSFKDALSKLAEYEYEIKLENTNFEIVEQSAQDLNFDYYIKFAEREGYIFDTENNPVYRGESKNLPTGTDFFDEDIERANNTLLESKELANVIDSKYDILKDIFNASANGLNFEESINQMSEMFELDKFFDHIENIDSLMKNYISEYKQLGKGGYIQDAEEDIAGASAILTGFAAQGMDTSDFELFLEQCYISCLTIHATGMFNLNNQKIFDNDRPETEEEQFNENIDFIKARTTEIVERFKDIGADTKSIEVLKATIVDCQEPVFPQSIIDVVNNYKASKTSFINIPKPIVHEVPLQMKKKQIKTPPKHPKS